METKVIKADLNGVEISYSRTNEGGSKRIILIHGWTGFKELFKDFIPSLAEKGFDVVALDLRGHGDSAAPEGDYDHETFSRDIHALAAEIGWDDGFVLLGQSMGGYIVLDYALRFPETLTHLISSNTSAYLGRTLFSKIVWKIIIRMYKKDPAKMMKKMVPRFFQYPVSPEVIEEFCQMSLKTAKHAGLSAIMHCYNRNLEPELHKIDVPTLIIASEFDQKDLRNATLKIHELIPGSKLVDIPKTGHLPFMENPDEFLTAITSFVSD